MTKVNAYLGEWEACYAVSGDPSTRANTAWTPTATSSPSSVRTARLHLGDPVHERLRWQLGTAARGHFTNVFQRARGQFNGYGFNLPTQDLVDEFESGSAPLPLPLPRGRCDGRPRCSRWTRPARRTYYPKKNCNNAAEEALGDPNPNGHTNDRVIRLSDIMLFTRKPA